MIRKGWAALAVLALLTVPANAQLGNLLGVFGGTGAAASAPDKIEPGKKRPIYPNAPDKGTSIDIAPGVKIDTDLGESAILIFPGIAGKPVTIDVDSPDVHLAVGATRELNSVWTGPTFSQWPVAGGPKAARLVFSPKRTGPYYIFIYGISTKTNGKLDFGRPAKTGRYSISLTDADNPVAKPLSGAASSGRAAAAKAATPPPPAVPTVASLARDFAQRCAQITPATEQACARLREDLNDAMAGRLRPAALAAVQHGPLGVQVTEGAGGQIRAEVVTVDASGPAASAGIKAGDAILYARAPDGSRTFIGDQASLDAWATKANGSHDLAVIRAGGTAVELVPITLGPR